MVTPLIGFMGASGGIDCTFLTNTTDPANGTTYTFSSLSFGDAAGDRYIVACLTGSGNNNPESIDSCTIGGVTATKVSQGGTDAEATDSAGATAIYIAAVPTGTSGDVVATWNKSCARAGVGLFRVTGIGLSAYDAQNATTGGITIDVPAGGLLIACARNGTSDAWTGVTESYAQNMESGRHTGGFIILPGGEVGRTVSVTNQALLVAASWGP